MMVSAEITALHKYTGQNGRSTLTQSCHLSLWQALVLSSSEPLDKSGDCGDRGEKTHLLQVVPSPKLGRLEYESGGSG